jgi:hypothetical protein
MGAKRLEVVFLENNCYILICPRTKESAIIDLAADAKRILRETRGTEVTLKGLPMPGHFPGGVCFLTGKILFSGDTIFPNGPGNTAIPGANEQLILSSIHSRIFLLPYDTIIYPGHSLETTAGREKATPFDPLPQGITGDHG